MALEQMVAEHGRMIAAQAESLKSAHKRIDDFSKVTDSMFELSKNSAAMATEVKHLAGNVNCIAEKLDSVRMEPAHNWKTLIGIIIGAIVTAAISAIITVNVI